MAALVTTAVGSYPKPDYLTRARNEYSQGKLSREDLAELERQATEYWIRLQERLGLDILVHGEMERGDMVAYFAELFDSTDRPVKGMLTGPYTMVEWSFDEYYPSRREAVLDMARVIHQPSQYLAKPSPRYIQLDEPAIHTRPDEDFDLAVEAMQIVVEGVDAEFHTHICYGEVERIYPAMLRLPVKQIHLAFKNTNFDLLRLLEETPFHEKDLGVGVVDVHDRRMESTEEVAEGIEKALRLLPPERIWILPDCGLKTRNVEETEAKLQVMMEGVHQVKQALTIE
jgi:5-methyltetrahydropteroyltriglutamate--homocysteine methyltransferase